MIRKLYKDAGVVGLIELLVRLKGLILMPLLTHHLGAMSYGAWSQVGVLVASAGILVILGSDAGFVRHAAGHPIEQQKRWFSAWLVFLLCSGTVVGGGIALLRDAAGDVFFGDAETFRLFVLLAALTVFANVMLNSIRQWYLVQDRPRVAAAITALNVALAVIAVVVVLALDQTVVELILYSVAGEALLAAATLALIARSYGLARPDFTFLRPALRFGIVLVPTGFAVWGLNMMDRLFLVEYTTIAEVGVYSIVYTLGYSIIPLLARPFRMTYAQVSTGLHNRGDREGLQRLFNYSAGTVLALTVPATVGLAFVGRPLLAILTPPEFHHGAALVAVIAGGYVFNILASYYDVTLGLAFRQHWSTISTVAACAVNFGLNFLLIPEYGIVGAAWATALSYLVSLVISFVAARRYGLLRTDFGFVAKVMVASGVMAGVVYALQAVIFSERGSAGLELVTLSLAGAVTYGALCWGLGIVPREKAMTFLATTVQRFSR